MVPAKAAKIQCMEEDMPLSEQNGTFFNCDIVQIPPFLLPTGMMMAGARVPPLPVAGDPMMHLLNVRQANLLQDDILVTSYPGSGAKYLMEILPWLLQQNDVDSIKDTSQKLLEHMSREEIEAKTPPRIFLTHLYAAHFPSDVVDKNIKVIHVVRNPKDVTTSLFHRLRENGVFTFQQFLDLYLANKISIGHQFAFLEQIQEFQQSHPVLDIHFEDIAKKPVEVIQKLSQFLRVPASGSLCDHILSSNSLRHTIGQTDQSSNNDTGSRHIEGRIGSWKNTFTMAQNEAFNFFLFQTMGAIKIKLSYD